MGFVKKETGLYVGEVVNIHYEEDKQRIAVGIELKSYLSGDEGEIKQEDNSTIMKYIKVEKLKVSGFLESVDYALKEEDSLFDTKGVLCIVQVNEGYINFKDTEDYTSKITRELQCSTLEFLQAITQQ